MPLFRFRRAILFRCTDFEVEYGTLGIKLQELSSFHRLVHEIRANLSVGS